MVDNIELEVASLDWDGSNDNVEANVRGGEDGEDAAVWEAGVEEEEVPEGKSRIVLFSKRSLPKQLYLFDIQKKSLLLL